MKKILFSLLGVFCIVMAVSAQELVIDYQYNVRAQDRNNYFTFRGPHSLGLANRDVWDATTGASRQKSTAIFSVAYQKDINGRLAFPDGLRGLLLFPLSPDRIRIDDNLNVVKASNGVITIQYVHSGVAYRINTDAQGRLILPNGNYVKRNIGFAQSTGVQLLARDFSTDGTTARIDWARVWDARVASGRDIQGAPSNIKTGDIVNDWEDSTMFKWAGTLQFAFDGIILRISGTLKMAR